MIKGVMREAGSLRGTLLLYVYRSMAFAGSNGVDKEAGSCHNTVDSKCAIQVGYVQTVP